MLQPEIWNSKYFGLKKIQWSWIAKWFFVRRIADILQAIDIYLRWPIRTEAIPSIRKLDVLGLDLCVTSHPHVQERWVSFSPTVVTSLYEVPIYTEWRQRHGEFQWKLSYKNSWAGTRIYCLKKSPPSYEISMFLNLHLCSALPRKVFLIYATSSGWEFIAIYCILPQWYRGRLVATRVYRNNPPKCTLDRRFLNNECSICQKTVWHWITIIFGFTKMRYILNFLLSHTSTLLLFPPKF